MARLRRFRAGSVLFRQGDQEASAHVLLEGALRISQTGADGGQFLVRVIAPGQTFGSVALFTDHRYPAEAVAILAGAEASWREAELAALIAAYPKIAVNLLRVVGGRLQEAQERLRELATQRVEQRLASILLRLASATAPGGAGEEPATPPLRRRDLADLAGATLSTVSRQMSAWEHAGLIETTGRRIRLRRPADLARLAEGL